MKNNDYSLTSLFAEQLLEWNRVFNKRPMPWKGIKDPYKIWISEIILQQTRVEQGLKYYQKFITSFPDVGALAEAPEELVFKHWEGLGYYSRCRNLIYSAKWIVENLNGNFPDNYEGILQLKGVGRYTAAAIGSFAFDLPFAVVDGNVLRVLSRITGSFLPVDSKEGKDFFSNKAQEILPLDNSAEYNQAIMDFGATICKPQPLCEKCFFSPDCKAFTNNWQHSLPVKKKKGSNKKRYFYYYFTTWKNQVLIKQRTGKDIWNQLFEFPLVEVSEPDADLAFRVFQKDPAFENCVAEDSRLFSQKLTHQDLCFNISRVQLNRKRNIKGYHWVAFDELNHIAFPKTLQSYIRHQNQSL